MSIILELREAQKLYEDAGVDGSEGARMMRASADEIDRLCDEVSDLRAAAAAYKKRMDEEVKTLTQ